MSRENMCFVRPFFGHWDSNSQPFNRWNGIFEVQLLKPAPHKSVSKRNLKNNNSLLKLALFTNIMVLVPCYVFWRRTTDLRCCLGHYSFKKKSFYHQYLRYPKINSLPTTNIEHWHTRAGHCIVLDICVSSSSILLNRYLPPKNMIDEQLLFATMETAGVLRLAIHPKSFIHVCCII